MSITEERITPTEDVAAPPRAWRVDLPGVTAADLRPVKWQLYLALVGLFLGVVMGLLQALERVDIYLYDVVGLKSYYQGLTIHGVVLAIVFTFTFANSFMSLTTMKGFGRPLVSRAVANTGLWLAWIGTGLAAWAMLTNKATVLFTFYSPMKATTLFYVGAVFLVLSTWATLLNQLLTLHAWRKDHRGERIPLLSFTSIITMIMWTLASVGIAIEVLGFLIPWSLGWIDNVDPQFNRILFWFTGHPIVYFWLLPIYVSWYLMLPKAAGGKLYSDGLTRLAFLFFLVLLPVGVHHQFTDPGIGEQAKIMSWLLTMMIFVPSMITAFSVIAGLEMGGRSRGGKGILGWIPKLPWGDPSVSAQLLAGLGFFLGGASGLINASFTLNLVVHNSAFIPGHFHLTVGTAVALSIMGICYWLVPYLTGKRLALRRLAVLQGWLWLAGVLVFSRGQMAGGLEGMPRRTQIADAVYLKNFSGWDLANTMTAIGGTVMFLSGALFFVVMVSTIFNHRAVDTTQRMPITETIHGPRESWKFLDRIGIWSLIAVVLSVLVYGITIWHYWPIELNAPGVRVW